MRTHADWVKRIAIFAFYRAVIYLRASAVHMCISLTLISVCCFFFSLNRSCALALSLFISLALSFTNRLRCYLSCVRCFYFVSMRLLILELSVCRVCVYALFSLALFLCLYLALLPLPLLLLLLLLCCYYFFFFVFVSVFLYVYFNNVCTSPLPDLQCDITFGKL